MCELLGFSSDTSIDIRTYLRSFYGHSCQHPHGWGFMRELNEQIEIIKEPVCANESQIISRVIDETSPQRNAMAHIRLATVGAVNIENCHPFIQTDNSGRCWTMMHNGTIYSSKKLTKYLNVQSGDTDSERIFLYLLDEINGAIELNGGKPLTAEQRFTIVDDMVVSLSPRNKLNMIIFDGEMMFVHKNMTDTLYYKSENHSIVFSTTPLDDGDWREYPLTQLFAFCDGKKVFEGTKHNSVFVPTLEHITAFDAMNI